MPAPAPASLPAFDVARALELSERSTASRVFYAGLLAIFASVTLPWSMAASWFAAVCVWELLLRPHADRFTASRPTMAEAERVFALFALVGSGVFSCVNLMAFSTGTALGAIIGATALSGALVHGFVYYGGSRPILLATLAPLIVASLAGLLISLGLDWRFLVAAATTLIMTASGWQFLADKKTLLQDLVLKTAALTSADEANSAKSRFISTMSHELRTPLNAIIGYSELVQEDIADGRTPSPQDMEKVLAASRHLLSMIGHILDFSRIDAGDSQMEVSIFPITGFVNDMADLLRHDIAAAGNTLSIDIAADVEAVCADERRLKQCLINLLSNAAKFTRGGQIGIQVRRSTGGMAALTISDTGIGMSDTQISLLFEPFVQLDPSTSRPYQGVGLGLAISRRLMRQMGGDIEVTSTPGQGSRFSLLLPLATLANENQQPAAQAHVA